jgi:cation transporter-like permease
MIGPVFMDTLQTAPGYGLGTTTRIPQSRSIRSARSYFPTVDTTSSVPKPTPVKTFRRALLIAIGGYLVGLFSGMLLIEVLSSNTHDNSVVAAMTGAFVFGPLMALIAMILVFRSRRSRTN